MAAIPRPPFRADHVGSLLRPPSLLKAREDHAAGRLSAAALREKEDAAIRDVVKAQEEAGLQGITDGEYRRVDWMMDFKYGLGGVEKLGRKVRVPFTGGSEDLAFVFEEYRVGKLSLDRPIFGEDFAFLNSLTSRTAKQTLPSPSMMHYPAGRGIDRAVYPDDAQFFHDLAAVYAAEIAALGKLGCTYLQLDDTSFAFLNDPTRRATLGPHADTQHLRYIELFNASVAGRPADMAVCTHLCRGNFRSGWMSEGSYEHVAEALFSTLDVDGFFLEFDDERSGGFEPLRFVPKGKKVVLGLVTTKRPERESKDMLKRRVDAAAKFIPIEQLCLSPQCGFASTAEGNMLSMDDQFAKLRLLVDTARDIWGD